jgi:antitoxin YefM
MDGGDERNMAARSLTITAARDQLTRLPAELSTEHATLTVTRHGQPVLAVLPWDLYEALLETLEVMGDPALMESLRHSIDDIAAGRVQPLDDALAALDW